jgi:cell pole-organizing protein PopZ
MNQQSLKPNVKSSSLPKNLYQQNGLDPKSTIASPDTIKNSREQVRNAMAEIHKQKEIKRIASNANQDYSEYGSSLEFRSGYKLEDLAIEAMIPEIRRWIDSNLEKIVREVVEDQVKQILSDS